MSVRRPIAPRLLAVRALLRATLRLSLCLAAFAAAVASPARAEGPPAQCDALSEREAAQKAAELTALLQIANFRADLPDMTRHADALERFLDGCPGRGDGDWPPLVCGYECYAQLARQRLFLAADRAFLSSVAGVDARGETQTPQEAQSYAAQGVRIAEQGLRALLRAQGASGANADVGDADNNADNADNNAENADNNADAADAREDRRAAAVGQARFRAFTRQSATLNALKIRLNMSMGDIWYKTVSEARLSRLASGIAQTLDPTASATGGANIEKAAVYYEEALWTLIEAKLDIPNEASYDDLNADFMALERDLKARLDSLRSGYLYINLDPYAFTTIPFEDLERRLTQTAQRIADMETRVEAIIERWAATKEAEAGRQQDEDRLARGQQANLLAHEVAVMGLEAERHATAVQQEINETEAQMNGVDDAIADHQRRRSMRQLQISLQTRQAEFNARRQEIEGRQEIDLIAIEQSAAADRRADLRWMISFEMTVMGLEMQTSSIESQIVEYERQLQNNAAERGRIDLQREILRAQRATAGVRIEQANAEIQEAEVRSQALFDEAQRATDADMCAIERQLALAGGAPTQPLSGERACGVGPSERPTQTGLGEQLAGYQTQMCSLRERLAEIEVDALAFTLACVVGAQDLAPDVVAESEEAAAAVNRARGQCGQLETETVLAQRIWKAEAASMDQRRAGFVEQRREVAAQITFIEKEVRDFEITMTMLNRMLDITEVAIATASLVPEIQVHAAGIASGVTTKIPDARENAVIAFRIAREQVNQILRVRQIDVETRQQIQGLVRQLTQLRQAIEQSDLDRAIKMLTLQRTQMQIAGRSAQTQSDLARATLRSSLAGLQCEAEDVTQAQARLSLDREIARLQAEHARLNAAYALRASENALISYDIDAANRRITVLNNEIKALDAELAKLAAQEESLDGDDAQINDLITAAQWRIGRVEAARATVDDLADASRAQTRIIADLRERHRQGLLALNDAQIAHLEERMRAAEDETAEMIAFEQDIGVLQDERSSLRDDVNRLQGDILENQAQTQAAIAAKQQELTDLLSQIDDPSERRARFALTQEMLTEMMRGVPDHIAAKRRELERANRLLHLMRRRFAATRAVVGDRSLAQSPYVTAGSQLRRLTDQLEDARFFDERQINIDIARIVIPAESGFMRALALNGFVDFEISPAAASAAAMAEGGHFTLWSPEKFRGRRNMTLIDAAIAAAYACNTGDRWNRYTLSHRGGGVVFQPMAEGSDVLEGRVVAGPMRAKSQTFMLLSRDRDRRDAMFRYWESDFSVRTFPPRPGPPGDPEARLRYLGAPLISSYRLTAHPSDCPLDDAVLTFYLVFASDI